MTLEEFKEKYYPNMFWDEASADALAIGFAKYHVGQAKKQIEKEIILVHHTPFGELKMSDKTKFNIRYDAYIEIQSIKDVYPPNNIR